MQKTTQLSPNFLLFALFNLALITTYGQGKVCDNDSTGLIPLNDLGTGFYEGYQGGLYPFGANSENPASNHYKKGKNFAKSLKPLDTLGNINYEEGVILLGGFGPSIPGQLMTQVIGLVRDSLDTEYITNPCFDAFNLCVGGKGLDAAIGTTSETYWESIVGKLTDKDYSPLQVQVGWMYFNDKYDSTAATPTFPESPLNVTDELNTYLNLMMTYFPNMKIMFVSGRHYGGYADTTLEQYSAISEPYSYWNNFSVKWLIERQINNNPSLKYYGAGVVAPFITWGPYFWADGGIPRATDGYAYDCDDFREPDGYHLADSAYMRDADYLMNVIYTSPFSKNFVKDGLAWTACSTVTDSIFRTEPEPLTINETGITLYPNPANENVNIYRHNVKGKLYSVEIYNDLGQLVQQETTSGSVLNTIPIDVAQLQNGLYMLRTKMDDPITGEVSWFQEQFIKQ